MKTKTDKKSLTIDNEFEEEQIDTLDINNSTKITTNEKLEAEQTAQNIINRQREINEKLAEFDDETKEIMLNEMLNEYGLDVKTLTAKMGLLDPALPPSMIMNFLGWEPLSEMLQRIALNFKFSRTIPSVMIKNGLHRIFYRDFRQVDGLSAYKQSDYTFDPIHNPKGGIVVEEIWRVYRNIHIGFTMWDSALNQNTRDIALFIAIFNEMEFNMMYPISVIFYRMRGKMIATDIEWDGSLDDDSGKQIATDWSKLTADFSVDGKDDYDALTKLFSFFVGLNQPSRKNLPTRWNPKGLENNLMTQYDMKNYILVVPIAFEQYLRIQLKSGRFHDNYLNFLPEIVGIDYDKFFGEFNGDTNYKTEYAECDLRLIPRGSESSGSMIMYQYEGLRSQPNLNLTSVAHFWTLVGHAFHRGNPFYRIKFKSAGSPSGSGRNN